MAASEAQIKHFLSLIGPLAVNECNNRIAAGKGFVLPSICIAQSALETGYGTAGIMTKANAFFGIKVGSTWTGKVYNSTTREVYNGSEVYINADFRAYDNPADSVRDYYDLMTRLDRYADGISYGSDKSKWKTPRETITGFHKGGYATEPTYVNEIMSMVEYRKFTTWDELVTGEGTIATGHTYKFTLKDMVPGSLIPADAGRSIANDNSVINAIAVNWSDAPKPEAGTYTVTGVPAGMKLYVASIDSITPYIESGERFTFREDAIKFGFYLEAIDDVALWEKTGDETILDLPRDFEIVFSDESYPDSESAFSGVLAYFVKVE